MHVHQTADSLTSIFFFFFFAFVLLYKTDIVEGTGQKFDF